MLLESFLEARKIDLVAFFFGKLHGKLHREAEGVVQTEGGFARNHRFRHVRRIFCAHKQVFAFNAGNALVKFFHSRNESSFEFCDFFFDFVFDVSLLFDEKRIGLVVNLVDEDVGHFDDS